MSAGDRKVVRLQFPTNPNGENTRLLHDSEPINSPTESEDNGRTGYFFENVAKGIQDRDRKRLKHEITRYVSFIWAILSCACAGSITVFSVYGPLFQTRLHYSQYRVNVVSTAGLVSLYLFVPFIGYSCDRFGPKPIALIAGFFFGIGYFIAAFAYKSGPPPETGAGHGLPFGLMVFSFMLIGTATCSMYFASVTTCAKNFGRGKNKGFALSAPIAAFGLSGLWQSQVGSQLLFERNPDGTKGDIDVFRFFLFLGGHLLAVGIVGFFLLNIVDEKELIEEAIDELERSGLLNESEFYRGRNYGTVQEPSNGRRESTASETEELKRQEQEEKRRKAWLQWAETKRFLSDPTMWWLAAGFFLLTGPGDAFINNLGTVIGTLYPPPGTVSDDPADTFQGLPVTTPATHVSILAITSTIARLGVGTLSDILSPPPVRHQHLRGAGSAGPSLTSSIASLDPLSGSIQSTGANRRYSLSRLPQLLFFAILLSLGYALLASGVIEYHAADRLWIVTALVGTGYGAAFSLVPVIISCVWGVENFGTNWGIVAVTPAPGATIAGLLYAAIYEKGSENSPAAQPGTEFEGRCWGVQCYALTFWIEAAAVWFACLLWIWAWRGPGGWKSRGVAV